MQEKSLSRPLSAAEQRRTMWNEIPRWQRIGAVSALAAAALVCTSTTLMLDTHQNAPPFTTPVTHGK